MVADGMLSLRAMHSPYQGMLCSVRRGNKHHPPPPLLWLLSILNPLYPRTSSCMHICLCYMQGLQLLPSSCIHPGAPVFHSTLATIPRHQPSSPFTSLYLLLPSLFIHHLPHQTPILTTHSKPPVNPPEERLPGSSWPPRLPASLHLPPVVSRSRTGTGPEPLLSVRSGGTRSEFKLGVCQLLLLPNDKLADNSKVHRASHPQAPLPASRP
jgi:hypothetical protein